MKTVYLVIFFMVIPLFLHSAEISKAEFNDLAEKFISQVQAKMAVLVPNIKSLEGIQNAKIESSNPASAEAGRFLFFSKNMIEKKIEPSIDPETNLVTLAVAPNSVISVPGPDGIDLIIGLCEINEMPKIGTTRKIFLTPRILSGANFQLFYYLKTAPNDPSRVEITKVLDEMIDEFTKKYFPEAKEDKPFVPTPIN